MTKSGTKSKPKPRKYWMLWQSYLFWFELVEMRKRHLLRISAIERGASQMDEVFERNLLEHLEIDKHIRLAKKLMTGYGEAHPMWAWVTAIKGLGAGGLAAQLLAQIDDIALFDTVSKLWRFCGYAVIEGTIDRCKRGEKSPYNRRLKSVLYLIGDQFVRQRTVLYADIYYEEKERQRRLNPDPICSKCGAIGMQKGKSWHCSKCKAIGTELRFTPNHLDRRAKRKMVKIFLQHLWITWRQADGLPVTLPYAHELLGHKHYVPAPLGAAASARGV